MTALSGPFVLDATNGSDSLASGVRLLGSTAVTTQALFSSGSSGLQCSSTAGMSAGDVIYVPSNTSGRKFNVIASVLDSSNISCDYNWGDSGNGVAIYVGGKRATLGGLTEVFDATLGFDSEVKLETDVTMNASAACGSSRSIKIYSDQEQTQRKITTNQKHPLGGGKWDLADLTFHSTYGSDARLLRSDGTVGRARLTAQRCVFGDVDDVNNFAFILNGLTLSSIGTQPNYITMRGCLVVNLTEAFGGYMHLDLQNCHIKNMPYINYPELSGSLNTTQLVANISGCLIENVTKIDRSTNGSAVRLHGNIFDGIAGSPIFGEKGFSYDSSNPCPNFYNNILTNCAAVSDNVEGAGNILYNTSTNISGLLYSTTLSSDPYVDRAGGDLNFTSDVTDLFTNSFSRVKQFGFNHEAGGGGGVSSVGMNGGING